MGFIEGKLLALLVNITDIEKIVSSLSYLVSSSDRFFANRILVFSGLFEGQSRQLALLSTPEVL